MRTRTRSFVVLAACLTVASVSCGDAPELDLLGEREQELERLRRLQDVRVTVNPEGQAPVEQDISGGDVGVELLVQCRQMLGLGGTDLTLPCTGYPTGDACGDALCGAQAELCVSHAHVEVASARRDPYEVRTTVEWDIGAQSMATNTALLFQALVSAQAAIRESNDALRGAAGLSGGTSCGANIATVLDGRSRGEWFASTMMEAYHLYREATDRAVEANVAVADANYSTAPSLSVAGARAVAGPLMSRSYAAHLLVGGQEGLNGTTTAGFCDAPRHTPQIEAAISVIRAAAPRPADVKDESMSIDSFMAGTLEFGSVAARVSELWLDGGSPGSADELYDFLNLEREDFVAARAYLAAELDAFARTSSGVLDPVPLPGGALPTYARYAATAAPPVLPPAAHYEAVARFTDSANDTTAIYGSGLVSRPEIAQLGPHTSGLVAMVDAVHSNASDLLRSASGLPASPAGLRDEILAPLSLLAADLDREREGRARIAYFVGTGSTHTLDISIAGIAAADGVIVVRGDNGLRCAVEGSLEGAPCDLSALTHMAISGTDSRSPGFVSAAYAVLSSQPNSTVTSGSQFFFVAPEDPVSPTAGTFRALGSFQVFHGANYLTHVPLVPSIAERVAAVLAPNEGSCTYSAVSCAGESFDARIPLENELSDDGDGIENSWRYYLALARRSALTSDQRAEELFADGQQLDMRAEGAIDRLETLCGASIDPAGIVGSSLQQVRTDTACTTDAQCSVHGPEYRCTGDVCALDPVAMVEASSDLPSSNRIAECLGEDSEVPFVAIGNRDLCIWHSGDPNRYCESAPGFERTPCPYLAADDSGDPASACAHIPAPPGATVLVVDTHLEYFDTREVARPIDGVPPCDQLHQLRNPNILPDDRARYLEEVIGSRFFRAINRNELAGTLGWRAMPGGFSEVTLYGQALWGTGHTVTGAQTSEWPCAVDPQAVCPTAPAEYQSLFCSPIDCTDPVARGAMNSRLLGAVLGARAARDGANTNNILWAGRDDSAPIMLPLTVPEALPGGFTTLETSGMLSYETANVAVDPFNDWPWQPGYKWRATSGLIDFWYRADGSVPVLPAGGSFAIGTHPGGRTFASTSYPADLWGGMDAVELPGNGWFLRALRSPNGVTDPDDKPAIDLGFIGFVPSAGGGSAPTYGSTSLVEDWAFTRDNAFDAIELMCQAARHQVGDCASDPPTISSVYDLGKAETFLRCRAAEVERRAGTMVFANLPTRALDALRRESAVGAFPAAGGEFGAQVSALRAAMVDLGSAAPLLAAELRYLAIDLRELRLALETRNLQDDAGAVQFMSTVSNQIAACATAGGLGNPWAAVAACANSVAQIQFAKQLQNINSDLAGVAFEVSLSEFVRRFNQHHDAFSALGVRINRDIEHIDSALARVDSLRAEGRRVLSRALFLDSEPAAGQFSVAPQMRRRLNVRRARFEAARSHAVRTAYLAKRAIEQRLGLRLSEMRDDLPLVDAPASWEATICEHSGANYADLSRADGSPVTNYANAFVADYVTRLENVVESYRLDNGFHEGSDTAVVSLRDDIHQVRAVCASDSQNLLYQAASLDAAGGDSPGWDLEGCGTQLVGGELVPVPNCVSLLGTGDTPLENLSRDLGGASGYEVVFGLAAGGLCADGSTTCGLRSTTSVAQTIPLPPGRYRLSWHGQAGAGLTDPSFAFSVSRADGASYPITSVVSTALTSGWNRYHMIFDVSHDLGAATPPSANDTVVRMAPLVTSPMNSQTYHLGAPMLEAVTGVVTGSIAGVSATDHPPLAFEATGDERVRSLPVCEDTDGEVFRATRWRRDCVRLCSDGFASECSDGDAETHCFWETDFFVSQRDLDSGRLFGTSGFARGNYNYRIDSIGINVVGTSSRTCEDSELPSTCYSAGYVPFSLNHSGPFHVRNHSGHDQEVELFTGNIEHARALAAERYLTNPMSSADQALIGPYVRNELQGRPLDGRFAVRIWDEAGVNFEGVEDVQLVLNYRYWTRFE